MAGPTTELEPTSMNLIWSEDHLGHNISPAERPGSTEVAVIVSTRYWVDSVHEHVERPERDYFARRAELFLDHTLPSMLGQVSEPDRWLVLFSPWVLELPELKPVLEALDATPFATILVVPEGRAFSSISRGWIREHMRGRSARWVACARLDNDDALAADYVDALAKWVALAKPEQPTTVVFPIGIQTDAHFDAGGIGVDRLFVHPTNHFGAVVSKPRIGVFDPYETQHTEIYRTSYEHTKTIRQLMTRFPMWREILHGDNAANHYRPGPLIEVDPSRFPVPNQVRERKAPPSWSLT